MAPLRRTGYGTAGSSHQKSEHDALQVENNDASVARSSDRDRLDVVPYRY
jgi:hypothetical protein